MHNIENIQQHRFHIHPPLFIIPSLVPPATGEATMAFEYESLSSSNETEYSRSRSNPSDTFSDIIGRNLLNQGLRSIVMSRICFDIFVGFNPKEVNVFDIQDLASTRKHSSPAEPPNFLIDQPIGYFKEPARQSTKETNITKDMVTKLSVYFEEKTADSNAPVTVINGALVPGENDPRHSPPRLDVTIGMDQKLLAFVVLGLTSPDGENITKNMADMKLDKLFWEKLHQSVFYLYCSGERGVCDTTGNTVLQVNRAVLLCVLVTNGDRTRGRIAVFACQQKGQRNEFRIAVMWRKEGNCEELDQGYGSFIKAVVYLSKFNEKLHPHEKWKYMGPNCSKVTVDLNGVNSSFILRAYDNRACSTSRSPFLYKEWEMIKNETQRVLMVQDSGTGQSLEFRDQSDSNSMLFYDGEKRGKVEVIAIPFLEGSHGCYSIKAALSVAKFMEKMHSEGFVHGDIRGFNIVFSEDTGSLIDHDFGGKVDDVVFPNHYVQHLGDGRRPGCNGGESITADSDVEALVHVLFFLHVPVPFSEKSLIWYLGQQQITIDGIISVLESALKLGDVEVCPTGAYMSVLNA